MELRDLKYKEDNGNIKVAKPLITFASGEMVERIFALQVLIAGNQADENIDFMSIYEEFLNLLTRVYGVDKDTLNRNKPYKLIQADAEYVIAKIMDDIQGDSTDGLVDALISGDEDKIPSEYKEWY